jgi:hypothetical protein
MRTSLHLVVGAICRFCPSGQKSWPTEADGPCRQGIPVPEIKTLFAKDFRKSVRNSVSF